MMRACRENGNARCNTTTVEKELEVLDCSSSTRYSMSQRTFFDRKVEMMDVMMWFLVNHSNALMKQHLTLAGL
jgi:hypothetical protein